MLVVGHNGTNQLQVSSLLGIDMHSLRDSLDQSVAELQVLDFMSKVRSRLRLFNEVFLYEESRRMC